VYGLPVPCAHLEGFLGLQVELGGWPRAALVTVVMLDRCVAVVMAMKGVSGRGGLQPAYAFYHSEDMAAVNQANCGVLKQVYPPTHTSLSEPPVSLAASLNALCSPFLSLLSPHYPYIQPSLPPILGYWIAWRQR
jgi:hypothetical protein